MSKMDMEPKLREDRGAPTGAQRKPDSGGRSSMPVRWIVAGIVIVLVVGSIAVMGVLSARRAGSHRADDLAKLSFDAPRIVLAPSTIVSFIRMTGALIV